MTWQIESFTDVGGNKDQEFVKFIDLPSRTRQPFELADQRTADAAARARLGDGRRDERVAHAAGTTATSSSARRPSSASPSTPTSRPDRDGSAIGRSATWPRDGRRSCRTPAGRDTCRPARDCWRSRRPTRRSTASSASTATTIGTRGAPPRSRASTSTRAGCCRASSTIACVMSAGTRKPLASRPRRPGGDHAFRRPSPDRSRR